MSTPSDTHISEDEVRHIADLACIELTEKEVKKFQDELSRILDYIHKINEIESKDIPVTSHVQLKNVFRDDTAQPSLPQEKATAARAKRAKDGYFVISSVLDKTVSP